MAKPNSQGTGGSGRGAKILQLVRGGSSLGALLWILAALVIGIALSLTSFEVIEPGQVGVRVNNITGSVEAQTQPGLITRAPFGIHSVYIIDGSPQTFVMRGNKSIDDLHVEELTVRASDGSNFLFNDTTIIFQVLGGQAVEVLTDAGPDTAFRGWLRPFARSILRDEFGRESTISVSNPTTFGEATERARARLNELLEPHGVTVTKIVTPRPRFNEQYEGLIESRNGAENQLSVISSELERAATERERTLAEVDRDQNRSMQQKRTELEAALATIVTTQTSTKQRADTYRIDTVSQGQASKSAAERQAEELAGQLAAEYLAKKSSIEAFSTQPVERVMERLGEKLKGVTIDIQPWAEDASPSRVQLEGQVQ
jgi:regulator of protease activity HflC (stomatin/prohibitin superfamily)